MYLFNNFEIETANYRVLFILQIHIFTLNFSRTMESYMMNVMLFHKKRKKKKVFFMHTYIIYFKFSGINRILSNFKRELCLFVINASQLGFVNNGDNTLEFILYLGYDYVRVCMYCVCVCMYYVCV